MKINVHIERLILEGLPVTIAEGPIVQRAVEGELTRLLAPGGLSDEFRLGTAMSQARVGNLVMAAKNGPANLGQGIARAVYSGIGRTRGREARPRGVVR